MLSSSDSSPTNSFGFENRIFFARKEKFTVEIRCKNRETAFNQKRTSFLQADQISLNRSEDVILIIFLKNVF